MISPRALAIQTLSKYRDSSMLAPAFDFESYYDMKDPGFLASWGKRVALVDQEGLRVKLASLASVLGLVPPTMAQLNGAVLDVGQAIKPVELVIEGLKDTASKISDVAKIGLGSTFLLFLGMGAAVLWSYRKR